MQGCLWTSLCPKRQDNRSIVLQSHHWCPVPLLSTRGIWRAPPPKCDSTSWLACIAPAIEGEGQVTHRRRKLFQFQKVELTADVLYAWQLFYTKPPPNHEASTSPQSSLVRRLHYRISIETSVIVLNSDNTRTSQPQPQT